MTDKAGVLSVFHVCHPGREAEFEVWAQSEHLFERLAVPGFLFARRHREVSGAPSYFTYYLTETPAVLMSKPYLDRLDNPTPMTRKTQLEVVANANRTVCARMARRGHFRGAFVAIARFKRRQDDATLSAALEKLAAGTAVAGGEILAAVDGAGKPIATEDTMRAGDNRIAGALLIETLYQDEAEAIGGRLAKQFPDADVGIFRALCEIGRSDL